MTRILLTGGSGFVAAHVLETLLARGHSVVTTVRSQQKANAILHAHPELSTDRLDCAIVEDIAHINGIFLAFIYRKRKKETNTYYSIRSSGCLASTF